MTCTLHFEQECFQRDLIIELFILQSLVNLGLNNSIKIKINATKKHARRCSVKNLS